MYSVYIEYFEYIVSALKFSAGVWDNNMWSAEVWNKQQKLSQQTYYILPVFCILSICSIEHEL